MARVFFAVTALLVGVIITSGFEVFPHPSGIVAFTNALCIHIIGKVGPTELAELKKAVKSIKGEVTWKNLVEKLQRVDVALVKKIEDAGVDYRQRVKNTKAEDAKQYLVGKSYHEYIFKYLNDSAPSDSELLRTAGEFLLGYAKLSTVAKAELDEKLVPDVVSALEKVLKTL